MSSTKRRSALLLTSALTAATLFAGVAQAQDAEGAVEEVVVTGSRIVRSGFTTPTPVTVLGAQQLEALNVTNAGQALNQLPAFRANTTPSNNGFGSFNVGGNFINLRGLGVTRNLVLVDGRRFAPVTREGTADLNLIPSGLIERTEVVSGGASAAYGSDAIAGAVNIILNKRLTGIRGQVDGGISNEGDGGSYHASLAAGKDFQGGRGHFIIGGEYEKQLGIGSCFTRDWCEPSTSFNAGLNASRAAYARSDDNGGFIANQAGVISAIGQTGATSLTPGVNLLNYTAGIRNLFGTGGITFDGNGNPIAYTQGSLAAGNNMIGGSFTPSQQFTQVLVPFNRYSVYGHADYKVTDNINGFLEGSFGHSSGVTLQSVYFGAAAQIYQDNPFIPAQLRSLIGAIPNTTSTARPGQVAFNLARLGDRRGRSASSADTHRITFGFDGSFNDKWKWDTYYQYSHTKRHQQVENNLVQGANRVVNRPAALGGRGVNDPGSFAYYAWATDAVYHPDDAALPQASRRIVCRATVSADAALRAAAQGCVPLNPFGQGRASQAALDYVYRTLTEDIGITQHVAAGNLQGQLFDMGAGPVSIATGVEFRRDSTEIVHDQLSNVFAYFQNFGADYNANQKVIEAYVETDVPIVKDRTLFHNLSFNAAFRKTHYSISGFGGFNQASAKSSFDATTWKFGLIWEPTDWLRFRGTRSRDIRAPNFNELFQASASSFGSIINRFNANAAEFPAQLSGGNPNVSPERAGTTTVGFVVTPRWGMLNGFRLSVDWYDIRVNGYIAAPGAQNIVDRCFQDKTPELCSLIVYGAQGANGPTLAEVRNVSLNLQDLQTRGIDIEADYRMSLGNIGDLNLRALATITKESSTNLFGTVVDRAGETGAAGIPDWLLNVYATYTKGPFSTTIQARYIPKGLLDAQRIGPDQDGFSFSDPNSINDNVVDSRLYINLNASYNILQKGDRRLQVFGSVNNLFDKAPPSAPQLAYSTNPIYFDQIGRYYRVGLRFNY
jgi:outer membrane receptor protein involved in Fe transport